LQNVTTDIIQNECWFVKSFFSFFLRQIGKDLIICRGFFVFFGETWVGFHHKSGKT